MTFDQKPKEVEWKGRAVLFTYKVSLLVMLLVERYYFLIFAWTAILYSDGQNITVNENKYSKKNNFRCPSKECNPGLI